MEDLGFSSFDFMSMLGEVEEELDIEINCFSLIVSCLLCQHNSFNCTGIYN